ncbi:MAG TPA: FKBP-type peptidyl-prolyl cis-trans isomerase, partial [Puia sp.]|nr:FKBP-type peptidyl-prolyl cis-trans isomerase [Puia sp.]
MKKITYLLIGLALGAVSCTNSGFKKTKSGLLYKIYSDGKGPVAKKGEFIKLNFVQKVRDSVLGTTEGSVPLYLPVDSPRPIYNPIEILSLLRKGDSAVVVMLVDSMQRKFGPGQLPPFLKKKDKMVFGFKVLDIFASEDLLKTDRDQEMAKQKTREVSQIEGYLSKNNIQAQKTEKGTFYVIQAEGNGPQVDSGKEVAVRYTLKAMPSGKILQSNMTGPGNAPLKFVVGAGQIIPGWDDALRKFKQGGKGTLYIPAYLAYDQQRGPGGSAFENLIFDVE